VTLILADDAPSLWPYVETYVQKAIESAPGDMTMEWAFNKVKEGEIGLLIAHESYVITAACLVRVDEWRDGKRLNVLALGGEKMHKWADEMKAEATEVARSLDCVGIVAHGRKGFDRVFGAKPIATLYEMRL
jgi:hypothetical protein